MRLQQLARPAASLGFRPLPIFRCAHSVGRNKKESSKGMKGKGKFKARERELWGFDGSDDDFDHAAGEYLGASPLSKSLPVYMNQASWKGGQAIKPRNAMQEKYVEVLERGDAHIIVATGVPGSGKTLIPNSLGIQKLMSGEVQKLIITRPAVCNDEDIGFLPGTLEQKMDPWMRPIFDCFYRYMSPGQVQNAIAKQQIEICPLAFMRGRTFENAWICADEMQNSTPSQMLMILTRIGHNSKLIINGDPSQHDRGYDHNGLADLLRRIREKPKKGIELLEFTEEHIERHPVIRKILHLYNTDHMPSS